MFDLFKKKVTATTPDVKTIRENLLQFIKTELAKAEGGEGSAIKTLQVILNPVEAEKHLYEAAVFSGDENKFKESIQKIADDFALRLPENWDLDIQFEKAIPAGAIKATSVAAALVVRTKDTVISKQATAYIRVLNGEAEQAIYTIKSGAEKITIGREKNVRTRDHFFRTNVIAFPAESLNESNKYISRQHAHIEWDASSGSFLLFASYDARHF